ncbi:hypothetical protein AJ78_06590 [Emergomyces pasteurianus Ep9510]|uniref:ThuA-like domain-containing protein n=1 Tax=Emergomyces pasteurianus Ep9510 TaxID=1447872 RepID=A0A1J9PYA2_9EURO|nr:hypothetical protein AJ78_06590 [Emergomyces pasteurianus Ep9510]
MSTSEYRIFLLSLDKRSFFDEMYKPLLGALASKASVQRATKPAAAISYLSTNTPTAIIVTDPGIVKREHSAILEKVISYASHGGIVILAGHFSSFVRPDDLNEFFHSRWNVPWKFGEYQRTTLRLNPQARLANKAGLPAAYSQKAVFPSNVPLDAALYLPTEDSVTESLVFPPMPVADLKQTPVVFAPVGEGWLGYVGDVNAEVGSTAVVLAMCGL